jgi:type I restriction enzyme, S subunit
MSAAIPAVPIGKLIQKVVSWNPPRDAPDDELNYIDLSAVDNTSKQITAHQTVMGREAPSRARQRVKAGDILVSTVRPNLNGIARVPEHLDDATASTGFCVLRPQASKLDASYLFHWVQSTEFVSDMVRKATGASYPAVSDKIIAQSEIPLPAFGEQKRIAAILDQADELRRKRQCAIDRLNQLGHAIFDQMFGDPVTNPHGFPIQKLGEVGILDRGISKHRPRNDPALLGGSHPLIQTGDVANADGYIRSFSSTYSDLGLKQSRKWPIGTLCITIAANIGKTAILEIDACFPDSVVGFTPGAGTNSEYVQFWMERIQKRLEEIAPQSAQKNINLAILRELPIPMPAKPLQDEFRTLIHAIEEQKSAFRVSQMHGELLFSSLQHRAFQGEL